jgi:hypothetical protein
VANTLMKRLVLISIDSPKLSGAHVAETRGIVDLSTNPPAPRSPMWLAARWPLRSHSEH